MQVAAGDHVIVVSPSYRSGQAPDVSRCVVEKVARKYFYVRVLDYGGSTAFSIETGVERTPANNSGAYAKRAYTPEAYIEHERRKEAEAAVWKLRRSSNLSGFTTDQLVRIAAIIDETS